MSRRNTSMFNLSFLDLLSGALGAVIFLFIITPKGGAPAAKVQQVGIYMDTLQKQIYGNLHDSLLSKRIGDTLFAVLVDYRTKPVEKARTERVSLPEKPEKVLVSNKPVTLPKPADRAAEPQPDLPKPEEEPQPTEPVKAPTPVSYRGDAPSVPCKASFEINWQEEADNVDFYVCRGNNCVYGGRKKDRYIGQWDSGKSRNRLFGNDLRTNQEAVRQFEEIIAGEYELYAQFKEGKEGRQSVKINGLIYTKNEAKQEQGEAFSKVIPMGADRVLIGKVRLAENGQFVFTKN